MDVNAFHITTSYSKQGVFVCVPAPTYMYNWGGRTEGKWKCEDENTPYFLAHDTLPSCKIGMYLLNWNYSFFTAIAVSSSAITEQQQCQEKGLQSWLP